MANVLKTDLYELSMVAAYLESGRNPVATFEMFVRRLPRHRGYLVVAGLAQVLEYLQGFGFDQDELTYLRSVPALSGLDDFFFDRLAQMRFEGDVWALPEGTLAFAGEPLLRVTAPLAQAQLVETFLLATVNFQTLVATKAARVVEAARSRPVVDFGSRRAHGPDAGVLAARAAYLGGCAASSNLEAGRRFGIPVSGTMAHSFVMSFEKESDAFQHYVQTFDSDATLLVDTYDTKNGARLAARLGPAVKAVRLDSGNLVMQARIVRELLDEMGRQDVKLLVSGNLNEQRIEHMLGKKAPVDGFGVGTEMVTSQDSPSLDGVYKLVEIEEEDGSKSYPVKLSASKATRPGAKNIIRRFDRRNKMLSDLVVLADEKSVEGQQIMVQKMRRGKMIGPDESLEKARERTRKGLSALPPRFRRLRRPETYPVRHSQALSKLFEDNRRG